MQSFGDFLPVKAPAVDLNLDGTVQHLPEPNVGSGNGENNRQPELSDFLPKTPSLGNQLRGVEFDWGKNNTDRYVQSDKFRTEGFTPDAYSQIDGKTYNFNEVRYGNVQSWSDVMSNAVGGAWGITKSAFTEGWKGDWRLLNAVFNPANWDNFTETLTGTPEELEQLNNEQKSIFNKYAIYHTPESDNTAFNRQFVGDVVQQLGFTIGTGAQMLSEAAITWGIGEAFSAATKGLELGKIAETVPNAIKAIPTADRINDIRKATDIWKNSELMQNIVANGKSFVKWSGRQLNPLTGVDDVNKVIQSGGNGWDIGIASVGAAKRLFSQTNMASTEARFEAAGTYGDMYGNLVDKYYHDNGELPSGEQLQRIETASRNAATDNYIVNTGLLMTMNQIQFGNLMSRFSSSSKLMRAALESGDKSAFTVTGKALDGTVAKTYKRGLLGAAGKFNVIRKDFGLGTALSEVTKRALTGTAAKFEISEGLQEILQNTSNTALTDYYTNLYNGNKDLNGHSIFDADYMEGISKQYNMEGWKTFLMGAVTGLTMSPLQSGLMYGASSAYGKINKEYGKERNQKKLALDEHIAIQNEFYKNINNVLNEKIANIKVQGQTAKNIDDALTNGDRYTFVNAKDDALAKVVSAAIKTDNYESLLSVIKEYAENMSDEELKQAFPALEPITTDGRKAKDYIVSIANDIEQYHDNWERLKSEFGHLIVPEMYKGEKYAEMLFRKRSLDEAIETLATTSYHATQTLKHAAQLLDKNAAIPIIGSALNTSFDILSDDRKIDEAIRQLEQDIITYDQLGRDPDVKDMKLSAREQLKYLKQWKSDQSIESFRGYVKALHEQTGTPLTNTSGLYGSYNDLLDYIQRYHDHGNYIDALNVLKDPKNFKLWLYKVQDAMTKASANLYEQQMDNAEQNIQNDPNLTGEIVEHDIVDDINIAEQTQPPIESEPVIQEIIQYYSDRQPNQKLSKEAELYLKQFPGIRKKLNAAYQTKRDTVKAAGRIQEILNEFRDIRDNNAIPFFTSPLAGFPTIVEKSDQYRISLPNPIGTKDFKTVREANEFLQNYLKEQSKPGGRYEKFKVGDRTLQVGQTLYRENDTRTISSIPSDKTINVKSGTGAVMTIPVDQLEKWHDTFQEGQQHDIDHIQEGEEDHRSETSTQVESDNDFKLAYNDMFSILPFRNQGESQQVANANLSRVLSTVTSEQLTKGDISIVATPVTPNLNPGNPTKSPDIKQVSLPISYEVRLNDTPLFFIMDNGSRYLFNVSRNGTQELIPANKLTKDEFFRFFRVPGHLRNLTPDQVYEHFKSDIEKVNSFTAIVSEKVKDKPVTFTKGAVHKLLNFNFLLAPNFQKQGSSLQEVIDSAGLKTDINGLGAVIINNSQNTDHRTNNPWFGGTQDTNNEIENAANSITPHRAENRGMASIPLQLPNGKVMWVELSPKQLSQQDLMTKLNGIKQLVTGKQGFTDADIEGGSKSVNDILNTIFTAFNVYGQPGKIDYSQKWKITARGVRDKKTKFWHITLFLEPTIGEKSEREEKAIKLDKVVFDSPEDFANTINRAINEKDKNGAPRHPEISHLQVTPTSFKEQVFTDDWDSIMTMSTNLGVQNGMPYNLNVVWDYRGPIVQIQKSGEKPMVSTRTINQDMVDQILNMQSISELKPEHREFIKTLVEPKYQSNLIKIKSKLTGLTGIEQKKAEVNNTTSIAQSDPVKMLTDAGYEFVPDANQWLAPDGKMYQQDILLANIQAKQIDALKKASQQGSLLTEDDNIQPPIDESDGRAVIAAKRKRDQELKNAAKQVKRKVLSKDAFNTQSVANVDAFREWCKNVLPDFISVEDIEILTNNLTEQNVTVGQFLNVLQSISGKVIGGKILTSDNSPYKYHEAFHAVFNLLLSDEQINRLLTIARTQKSITQSDINTYVEQNPETRDMSKAQLENRILEEYLADKFEQWKTDRSVPAPVTIKSLFRKLLDFIVGLFTRSTRSELDGFFHEIDRGKFRNTDLQNNQFTRDNIGVTLPKSKVLTWGEFDEIDTAGGKRYIQRTLSQQSSDQITSAIAGMFVQEVENDPIYQQNGTYDKNAVLDKILDLYRDTLDWEKRWDYYDQKVKSNIKDKAQQNRWWVDLDNRFQLFSTDEGRQNIKDSVNQILNVMGFRQKLDQDINELDELENGPMNTEKLERVSAFSVGGYDSVPTLIRKFIGATTYTLESQNRTDEFFNDEFVNGQPIVESVNAGKVYNGMLKSLADTPNGYKLLDKLVDMSSNSTNPETSRFVNHIFEMTGLDPVYYKQSGGDLSATKNQAILQQVLKAFNQFTVNSLFVAANEQTYIVSGANVHDAGYYQMQNWVNGFMANFYNPYITKPTKQFITDAIKPLSELRQYLKGSNTKKTNVELHRVTANLSQEILDNFGISLHPDYLYYSILKSKNSQGLYDDQATYLLKYSSVPSIAVDPLSSIIEQLQSSDKNLFARDETGTKVTAQTLNIWADGNAVFDESIDMMNHTNAEGQTVTNYVSPYYLGSSVLEMNEPDWLNNLSEEFREQIVTNPLLQNSEFQTLQNNRQLHVDFIDGIRKTGIREGQQREFNAETGEYEDTGEDVVELYGLGQEGSTYRDFSNRELLLTLLAMYNTVGQSDIKVYNSDRSFFYKLAVPIRVPSEKGMFGLVKLPVIHSVNSDGKLSDKALSVLYNRVQYEFDRIKQVYSQTLGKQVKGHNAIKDWNTGKMRGLSLFMTGMMVESLKSDIEQLAKDGGDLNTLESKIKDQINAYFTNQVQSLISRMETMGILTVDENEDGSKSYDSDVLPSYLFDGQNEEADDKLNLVPGDFVHNLTQVYMNSFLNTSLINNLVHGDESRLYKDGTDAVKRESGSMATGKNIEIVVPAPNLGINHKLETFHHITLKDESVTRSLPGNDKPLDVDDGQMYNSVKALRYTLYGKGTLTKLQADILTDLQNGKPVSRQRIFESGGLKDAGSFNSLKLVYMDGQVYLKCSSITLFPELTSYKVGDKWEPLPGKQELHDLRERMEKYESDHPDTIVYAHPTSVSKMLTRNIVDNPNSIADNQFEQLSAQYMREQLENPSGKVVINDPTQAKGQIMNELDDNAHVQFMGKDINPDTNKPYTVRDIKNIYLQKTADRYNNNWVTARDGMFKIDQVNADIKAFIDTKKVTARLGKFLEHAKRNLEATGSDSQMIDFMEVGEDGNPVYNINFPSVLPKITQIFFSYFSGGVLREQVPGMSLALVSPARGLGSRIKRVTAIWTQEDIDKYKPVTPKGDPQILLGQPRIWEVITNDEFKKSPSSYSGYKQFNNKNERLFTDLQVGDLILDDLRDNYLHFENGAPVGYFSEMLRPAHFSEEMSGIPESLQKSFSTRIPSVDKNSYSAAMFIDILPAYMGSILVVPREYYERTGADNDIDKDYVSMPDTYVKDGKRIAYGSATTDREKFDEYVQWQIDNNRELRLLVNTKMNNDPGVQESRQYLKDLYGENKDLQQQFTDNERFLRDPEGYEKLFESAKFSIQTAQKENKEQRKDTKDYIQERYDYHLVNAFKEMGLADSVGKFKQMGGETLNNGVLNNEVLSAKIGMLNNAETIKHNNTATGTEPVKQVIEQIKSKLEGGKSDYCKQVLDRMNETNVDVNSILGILNDFDAVMTGAQSIGSVATTNIVYAFLNEFDIKLRDSAITIDGKKFDSFSHLKSYVKETKSFTGNRIFAALTALTNVMTDNPKERDAGKLNLDKTATGIVAYMIAAGVPEETAYLYPLQPEMAEWLRLKANHTIKTGNDEYQSASGYLQSSIEELVDNKVKPKKLTTKALIDNIRNGETDDGTKLAILQDIERMEKQTNTFFKLARIIRLNQGFKPDMEDFDQLISDMNDVGIVVKGGKVSVLSDKEMDQLSEPPVVDVRKALLKDNKIYQALINAVNQLNATMPTMFMERVDMFNIIKQGVIDTLPNLPISPLKRAKFMRTLKYDIIGYLGLRAYKYWLQNNAITDASTLNHDLIYSDNGILKLVDETRTNLRARKINNYLLEHFLVGTPANEKFNINVLEANTWSKLTSHQQNLLIGSFTDLYSKQYGVDTHNTAVAMYNYLLVKDGGQFSNGSFIRMLPNFIFKDMMDSIGAANKVLTHNSRSEVEKIYGPGITSATLINDFLTGYGTHIANKERLLQIGIPSDLFDHPRKPDMQDKFNKLSQKERETIAGHMKMEKKGYTGNKVINRANDYSSFHIDLFGGISSADKGSEMNKVIFTDNINHLTANGFKTNQQNQVQFPITFTHNGQLYLLRYLRKQDKSGKFVTVTGNFVANGESIPTGVSADYQAFDFRGSMRQWKGASAIGEIPVYQKTKREQVQQEQERSIESLESAGYIRMPYQINKNLSGMRYEKDGVPLVDERGQFVGNPVKALEILNGKDQPTQSSISQEELDKQIKNCKPKK